MAFGMTRRSLIQAGAALPLVASFPALARGGRRRIDRDQLAAIPAALQPFIDRGDVAGIVTMTYHRGEMVQTNALGWRDLDLRAPMQRDTLFRVASMTKAVTSVAVLIAMEQGKLRLSDPVTKWIPELADRRVLRNPEGPVNDTVPARRDITIKDLLTHEAGLGLGLILAGPVKQAYDEAIGPEIGPEVGARIKTTDEWLAGLGTLPMIYQPGDRMNYSVSTDVLGFVLERIEGKPLQQVYEEQLFGPLGMKDTDFWVPPEKRNRLATLYTFDAGQGRLVEMPAADITRRPSLQLGAAGLISSADDFSTFGRMLLGGGRLGSVRLLKRETVRDMRSNHLSAEQRQHDFIGRPVWRGMSFGLGVALVTERHEGNIFNGSPGSYGWGGGFGTMWMNDPVEDLCYVYLTQYRPTFSPNSGTEVAGGRNAPRMGALPTFENMTYGALGYPPMPVRRT